MTRNAQFLLALMTAASLVLAVGTLAWRWQEAGDLAAIFAGPKPFRPVMLMAMPAMLLGLMVLIDRAMAGETFNRYGQGFVALTMATNFAVLLGMQAWMAVVYLDFATPDGAFVTRLLAAFLGLGMAVRGNFFAKLSPPVEDPTGAWARTTRRTGLILVLLGLVVAACAVSLPTPAVLTALAAAFLAAVSLTRVQRRASRAIGA